MTYKVIFKRILDKNPATFYSDEQNTKQFLCDLRESHFWVLHGRAVQWSIDKIEILQIFDINYDNYFAKWGYVFHVWPFNGNIGAFGEYMNVFDLDSDFSPEEIDITRDLLMDYYRSSKHLPNKENKISKVVYDSKMQVLLFDDKPFSLKESSIYLQIAKIFFENWESESKLALFCDDIETNYHHWELDEAKIRAHISYFNRQIQKRFWIKDLIRISDKALNNSFPVILKNSESQ